MIASPVVGMKRMLPRTSGGVTDLAPSEDEAPTNNVPCSTDQRHQRRGGVSTEFGKTPDVGMGDKTAAAPRPTLSRRDPHIHVGVTRGESAMDAHSPCAPKHTTASEDAPLQSTTPTGPDSEESAALQHTLSGLGGMRHPLSPSPHVVVRDSLIGRASYEHPWGANSFCSDREWGVSQITAFASTSEIRLLSSWCTPAA